MDDFRILVSIDFGTTYSGFAYVHKENPETVVVNNSWPGKEGAPKAPTALQYDNGYKNVTSWGNLALEEDPDEEEPDDTERQRPRPVELFKLHISNLRKKELPWLPPQLHYTKAIEDYITQMRKLIQVTLERRWPTINFPQQVGFVLTIPAEWPPHTTKVMRESEAAALHCLSVIKEHNLQPNDSFLVADCGGGTVDLTLRKLLPENKLSEITERVGDLCGSTFVDKEFLHWLGRKVGFQALAKLKTDNYGQMQYLVQRFFCTQQMEEAGWILKVDYETVKEMFDPVIDRIINLIDDQLKSSSEKNCSAMFLVGGFSESPYLLRR
ncbi:5873_t:CDS:2, partial [Rhizophagus irregularis]